MSNSEDVKVVADLFEEESYYGEKFEETVFSRDTLSGVKFYDCTFAQCDFEETLFKGCSFSDCVFEGCNLNLMNVLDTRFSQVTFRRCKVIGVNWSEAAWPRVAGRGMVHFHDCAINHSTFIGLALPGCTMAQCVARNVDFRDANFREGNMSETDFADSLFNRTDLTGCDFSHARNYAIDPSANAIKKATFMLPEAISLLYCMDIRLKD